MLSWTGENDPEGKAALVSQVVCVSQSPEKWLRKSPLVKWFFRLLVLHGQALTHLDQNKLLELCGWCVHCSKLKSTPASGPAWETVTLFSIGHFLFWDDLISCYKQLTSLQGILFFKHLHYCPTKSNPSLIIREKNKLFVSTHGMRLLLRRSKSALPTEVSQLGKPLWFCMEVTKQKVKALCSWVVEVGCYRWACVLITCVQTAVPQAIFHKVLFVHFHCSQSVSQMFSGLDIGR